MKRAAVLLVLVAGLAATAQAAPSALVTPPAGWHPDPEQATAVAQRVTTQFGGAHVDAAAEVHVPGTPGIALIVTRATATAWSGTADEAARAAVDELHATSQRAALSGGAPHETAWHAAVDAANKQVVATLMWSDPKSHAVDDAHMVIATDGKRIVAVTGECYATDDAAPALIAACRTALATLETGIAPASRVALGLADAAPPAEPASTRPHQHLTDGTKVTLPPMTISQAPAEADRRPIYIGGGLIVLAAAFWWNRRRRDRFEHEDGVPAPRKRRSDPDADDLHAAARGESEDGP